MGAFFTNVQVLAREGREQTVRDAIVAALAERAQSEGFAACQSDEVAERTILVGPPGRWIGVYDEATESQAVERLEGLAKALSGAADVLRVYAQQEVLGEPTMVDSVSAARLVLRMATGEDRPPSRPAPSPRLFQYHARHEPFDSTGP